MKFTLLGRVLIALAVVAISYFGFKWLGGADLIENFKKENIEASSESENATDMATTEASSATSGGDSEATAVATKIPFTYKPLPPVNGRLKGVVELGASGFNSFIIRIDEDKNWALQKAEFGNSLVLENMATDDDVRIGLKKYIGGMLDFGVGGKNIHFVVSSGAQKAEGTQKIVKALKSLNYQVNEVTPEKEGKLALKSVLPADFESNSFVVDIGSGNTKISWKEGSSTTALETYGAKYFQNNVSDEKVSSEVMAKAKQIPSSNRKTCFIIGGVPFEMAKKVRNGKERYTVLDAPDAYKMEEAKSKAGVNIYKAIAQSTGTQQFVFDWDANFTIGFLLELP
ncbi:MAG: hypothetical protein V4683_14210 [Bacteroidota bacterium]